MCTVYSHEPYMYTISPTLVLARGVSLKLPPSAHFTNLVASANVMVFVDYELVDVFFKILFWM